MIRLLKDAFYRLRHLEFKDRASLLLATMALLVSFYFGEKANTHNELSVSPFLDVTYIYVDDQSRVFNSGIRVDNPGVGPALIESMQILWADGTEMQGSSTWAETIKRIGVDNAALQTNFTTFKPGNALKAGRAPLELFMVAYDSPEGHKLEEAIRSGSIDVRICYRSLHKARKISSLQGDVVEVSACPEPDAKVGH